MPMTGDDAKLRQLGRSSRALGERNSAEQTRLLTPVKQEIKLLLRDEFTRSVDPSGDSWQETVRGRAALVSKKLPFAFEFGVRDGAVVAVGKSKRDLLDAHQHGTTFQKRQVAALQQFLTFKNGKLIKNARALNKKGEAKRGVHQTFARAHEVGERELPVRQIIPEGNDDLPAPWEKAVERGVTTGMTAWHDRVK